MKGIYKEINDSKIYRTIENSFRNAGNNGDVRSLLTTSVRGGFMASWDAVSIA